MKVGLKRELTKHSTVFVFKRSFCTQRQFKRLWFVVSSSKHNLDLVLTSTYPDGWEPFQGTILLLGQVI